MIRRPGTLARKDFAKISRAIEIKQAPEYGGTERIMPTTTINWGAIKLPSGAITSQPAAIVTIRVTSRNISRCDN